MSRDKLIPELIVSTQFAQRKRNAYSYNLRTCVVRTSTTRLEQLVHALKGSHTEICDFDVALTVQKEILWFQIAMADVEAMTVVYARDAIYVGQLWLGR